MPPAKYPWDSHQNAVVNSVELPEPQSPPSGVAHYRKILQERRTYPKICTDLVKEYRHKPGRTVSTETTLNLDSPSLSSRSSSPDPTVDYTIRPAPPRARSEYNSQIYHGQTSNTAICLAIIRIAEKNLPFIDFISATNHLPNLAPSDPLPALPKGIFTGDLPFSALGTDVEIKIAFLPEYYSDLRHALGYYVLLPGIADPVKDRITACVFTPCTTKDLENWDMLLYQKGREKDGVDGIDVVGARDGAWVKPDDGKDLRLWRVAWWVLARWEKKIVKTLERDIEVEMGGGG